MDFKTCTKSFVVILTFLLLSNKSLADDPTLGDVLAILTNKEALIKLGKHIMEDTALNVGHSDMFMTIGNLILKQNMSFLKSKTMLRRLGNRAVEYKISELKEAIDNEQCFNHTLAYLEHFFKGSPWALKMFDSSTKFPEGVLTGQTIHFGNYDECIQITDVPPEVGDFKGQYCIATFDMPAPVMSYFRGIFTTGITTGREVARQSGNNFATEDCRVSNEVLSVLKLHMAYCIPSTCSAKNFEDALKSIATIVDPLVKLNPIIMRETCEIGDHIVFQPGDWTALVIITSVLVVILLSTAYDVLEQGNKAKLLTAFSLYSNAKKMLGTQASEDSVRCLHGIRVITMFWVILVHRALFNAAYPDTNKTDILLYFKDWKNYYVINPSLQVDTFFFISGFLISYLFLKNMRGRTSGFNIPVFYLLRFMRLTPLFAVIILVQGTLLRYLGTGPLAKKMLKEMAKGCHEYWWKSLFYINNYGDINSCVPHGWYNCADMQLYILSPLILYPLWKWPRRWNVRILSVIIAAGIIVPFTISYANGYPVSFVFVLAGNHNSFWENLYLPTHARFGAWTIGIAFGYMLLQMADKKIYLSKLQVVLLWTLGLGMLMAALNGAFFFYQFDEDYSILSKALYNSLFRNMWAFGVGTVILLCELGYGGPINSFLTWKGFQPLSRLTYSIYLTHLGVQILILLNERSLFYYSKLNVAREFFADSIMSILVAAVFSLCFEAPIIAIAQVLIDKQIKKFKEKENEIENAKKKEIENEKEKETENEKEKETKNEKGKETENEKEKETENEKEKKIENEKEKKTENEKEKNTENKKQKKTENENEKIENKKEK